MSKLGALLSLEYGEPLPAERRTGHGFPVFGSNGEVGRHQSALIAGPGIVVGRKGSVGKVTWSDDDFWPIDTTYWVNCPPEERRWLYWVLSWLPLHRLDTSTGIPGLNRNDVYELEVYRADGEERRQIAQILDILDTTIHETEALIDKLKAVKQGLLHDLLTRGIDASGQLRPPQSEAPQLYKESPLGWIPREWEVAPLVSRIDFPEGQVDPRRLPFRDWVLIAPDHIEPGTGQLIYTATAGEQQAISGKYLFEAGDVIYSKIRPYLRKAVLATHSGLCSADMYPLRPSAGLASRFLLAVILGDQFSRFAESVSMRSGFPKINRSEMAEFSTGWPPLEEQLRISQILEEADSKGLSAESEYVKLKRLKSGLMDDLLTGRVRITPLLESGDEA